MNIEENNHKNSRIHIFHSFKEQEEFELQQAALLSPEELLSNLEEMRKKTILSHPNLHPDQE